jgi:glycosyltransferase involved in cell wall biosynthesis
MALFVSCLASVYHSTVASEFRSSLDSLLAGISLPDEVVVVVDGPISDPLDQLLRSYCNLGFVKVVRRRLNQGLAIALNAGLEVCTGQIVCRFDTDDINHLSRIFEVKRAFEADPALDIVGSSIYEFHEMNHRLIALSIKGVPEKHSAIVKKMDYANPFNHPSIAFKRSSILAIGGYSHMPSFEDYYLWLSARKAGLRFGNICRPLVYMRSSGLLARRSGFGYARSEAQFYSCCLVNHLVNPLFVPVFVVRCLSRLLPACLQYFQASLPWRDRAAIGDCPQLWYWLAAEKSTQCLPAVGEPYWTEWA